MKKFALVLLLYLFFVGCRKEYDEPKDTLVQYFQCVCNGNLVDLRENDSIEIYPSRSIEFGRPEILRLPLNYYSQVQIGHKLDQYQTVYDNIRIGFFTTYLKDEIDWNYGSGDFSPVYKDNKFASFFQPGEIAFLEQNCPNLITKPYATIVLGFRNWHGVAITYSQNCPDENNPSVHNEGGFIINKSQVYQHKKHGKCLLIEGTFEITVNHKSGTAWNPVLVIKEGKFKLLVRE